MSLPLPTSQTGLTPQSMQGAPPKFIDAFDVE